MGTVQDVAAAILERTGEQLDTWKLQKLVYYCQAWHLVWEQEPLFSERIEAWAGGPVIPALYEHHRGEFRVSSWPWGDSSKLSGDELTTIDAVLSSYGKLTGRQLRVLTHREDPWVHARNGLAPGERSSRVIDPDGMLDYYSGIADASDALPVDDLASTMTSE
jgi:uncharacterized phage-associated protein